MYSKYKVMTKMFKISKSGRYIESKYLNYVPANHTIDIHNWGTMLHEDRGGFETYRDKIIILEKLVQEKLQELELPHLNTKIIRFHLKFIEAVADGFDIRSAWSNEKIAERLVISFDERYNEAKTNCQIHLNNLKENPRKRYSSWLADEKYDRDNAMFELGMEPLEPHYSNSLYEMIKASNEMLELLIKERKDKK